MNKVQLQSYSSRIREIISQSDLNTITPKTIRLALESEFSIDLSSQKKELKELVFEILEEYQSSLREEVTSIKAEPLESSQEEPSHQSVQDDEKLAIELQLQENALGSRSARSSRIQKKPLTKRKAKTASADGSRKKVNNGFTKPHVLSAPLSAFIGMEFCSRPEVVKKIWEHVKSKNMQDPKDKRYICCDEGLAAVFGKKRVHMFEMNKILSKHLKPAEDVTGIEMENEEDEDQVVDSDDDAENDLDNDDDADARPTKKAKAQSKTKRKPSANNPFNRPVQLSPALATLLGEEQLSRPQVVKKIWEYIKSRNLQDPKDKRFILCDEGLYGIFKAKRVSSFGMNGV